MKDAAKKDTEAVPVLDVSAAGFEAEQEKRFQLLKATVDGIVGSYRPHYQEEVLKRCIQELPPDPEWEEEHPTELKAKVVALFTGADERTKRLFLLLRDFLSVDGVVNCDLFNDVYGELAMEPSAGKPGGDTWADGAVDAFSLIAGLIHKRS